MLGKKAGKSLKNVWEKTLNTLKKPCLENGRKKLGRMVGKRLGIIIGILFTPSYSVQAPLHSI
jgi:tetrahydromethanopterin S-methyltransferase subunit G